MAGRHRERLNVANLTVVFLLTTLIAACGGDGGSTTTLAESDSAPMSLGSTDSTVGSTESTENSDAPIPEEDDEGPIRVGSVFALTGAYSGTDKDSAAALAATVNKLNDNGGILGREVEFNIVDSQSDPAKAALGAQFIVDNYKPHVMVPDIMCLMALSALPIANDAGVVTFTGCDPGGDGSPSDPATYPLNFATFPPLTVQGEPLVRGAEIVMDGEPVRLGFLHSDDTAGNGMVEPMRAATEAAGHEFVGAEAHEVGSPDKTVQLQRLRQAGANVVVLFGQVGDAGHTMRGVRDIAWNDIQIVGNTGVTSAALVEEIPEELVEQFHAVVTANSIRESDDDLDPFIDTYLRDVQTNVQTLSVVGAVHDGIILWAWAAERAGSTAPDAIVAELQTLAELPNSEVPQDLMHADNHMFSPDQHGMANADLTNSWGLMVPSANIMGTYLGEFYVCEACGS